MKRSYIWQAVLCSDKDITRTTFVVVRELSDAVDVVNRCLRASGYGACAHMQPLKSL